MREKLKFSFLSAHSESLSLRRCVIESRGETEAEAESALDACLNAEDNSERRGKLIFASSLLGVGRFPF
jgi:hypothetical protein